MSRMISGPPIAVRLQDAAPAAAPARSYSAGVVTAHHSQRELTNPKPGGDSAMDTPPPPR